MTMKVIGKADRNKTVEQLMGEVARTGRRYLDLLTGDFISIVTDKPAEAPKAPSEPEVKKKGKR